MTIKYEKVNDLAIKDLCSNPDGPVQKDLKRRAQRVLDGARAMVGVETGRLKESLNMSREIGRSGLPEYHVGSRVSYALMHHEGTRPHIITPNLRKTLRFKDHGRTIYAQIVYHPGTRPNHYLTRPLDVFARG